MPMPSLIYFYIQKQAKHFGRHREQNICAKIDIEKWFTWGAVHKIGLLVHACFITYLVTK